MLHLGPNGFLGPQKQWNNGQHHTYQYGKHPKPTCMAFESLAQSHGIGIAALAVNTRTLDGNMLITVRKDLLQQQSKSIDVGATIYLHIRLLLLGSHIFQGAGRLFQHGIVIGIGKTEIDDFHIIAVSCHHNIAWLQVAVDDLLAMDVNKDFHQLFHHFFASGHGGLCCKKLVQSHAIHILHHDARANLGVHFLSKNLHNVGMVELGAQVKLLFQQLDISLLIAIPRLQSFQDEPLALSPNLHHLVEATRRRGLVHRQGIRLSDETPIDDSRCATDVHGSYFSAKISENTLSCSK